MDANQYPPMGVRSKDKSASSPQSQLFLPLRSKKKDSSSELRTQFSARSPKTDQPSLGKPPLKPRTADSIPVQDSQVSRPKPSPASPGHVLPQAKNPDLSSRSPSPKRSPSPVSGHIPVHAMIDDHLPSQRVAPTLPDGSYDKGLWNLDGNIRECISLQNSEMFFLSEQIAVCVKNKKCLAEQGTVLTSMSSVASMWGGARVPRMDASKHRSLISAAEEAALYMNSEYKGKHSIVVNTPALSTITWEGPIHFIQETPFQPAPLQESVMLLLYLERFLAASPGNIVLFFEGNPSVISALLRLLDHRAMQSDPSSLLSDLCTLKKQQFPLAGARRYLAMLEACMATPDLVEDPPVMLLASIRLYGDHDFVRSTETLIRVHAEIHHASIIDSTDLREQVFYRITRGSEAEACLVISFMPTKLSDPLVFEAQDPLEELKGPLLQGDVRILVFSTLKTEGGTIEGPKPMLQISFHTGFVNTRQGLTFLQQDIDELQGFCPIRRVVLAPGERLGFELMAPEVKFVRKKVRSNNPLDIIADLLIPLTPRKSDASDDDDRPLQESRPIELRVPGKVFRDDSPGNSRAGSRNSSSPGSGRTTPLQGASEEHRGTPTRISASAAAGTASRADSPSSRGSPHINSSPRIPVSPLQAMDGQVEELLKLASATGLPPAARRFKPISSSPRPESPGAVRGSPTIAAPRLASRLEKPPAFANPVEKHSPEIAEESSPDSNKPVLVSGSGAQKAASGRSSNAESHDNSRSSTPRPRLDLQGSRPATPHSRTASCGSNACAELGFALTPRNGTAVGGVTTAAAAVTPVGPVASTSTTSTTMALKPTTTESLSGVASAEARGVLQDPPLPPVAIPVEFKPLGITGNPHRAHGANSHTPAEHTKGEDSHAAEGLDSTSPDRLGKLPSNLRGADLEAGQSSTPQAAAAAEADSSGCGRMCRGRRTLALAVSGAGMAVAALLAALGGSGCLSGRCGS